MALRPHTRAPRRFLVVRAARERCGARLGVPAARRSGSGVGVASDGAGQGSALPASGAGGAPSQRDAALLECAGLLCGSRRPRHARTARARPGRAARRRKLAAEAARWGGAGASVPPVVSDLNRGAHRERGAAAMAAEVAASQQAPSHGLSASQLAACMSANANWPWDAGRLDVWVSEHNALRADMDDLAAAIGALDNQLAAGKALTLWQVRACGSSWVAVEVSCCALRRTPPAAQPRRARRWPRSATRGLSSSTLWSTTTLTKRCALRGAPAARPCLCAAAACAPVADEAFRRLRACATAVRRHAGRLLSLVRDAALRPEAAAQHRRHRAALGRATALTPRRRRVHVALAGSTRA